MGQFFVGVVGSPCIEAVEPVDCPLWQLFLERLDDVLLEGNDDDLIIGQAALFNCFDEGGNDFRTAFDFDENSLSRGDTIEDFFNGRDSCPSKDLSFP